MDVIVRTSHALASFPCENSERVHPYDPDPLSVGEIVAYYSSTHHKWIKTRIVRIDSDRVVDLACRKNVDISLIERTSMTPHQTPRVRLDVENRPPLSAVSQTSSRYSVGTKVEYFSESVNGWIQSIVRGHNADGTYCLNTKKSAHSSRVRLLVPNPTATKLEKSVHPPSTFLSVLHVDGNSRDLEAHAARILGALNLTFDHTVSKMKGLTGGQNEGIYFISGPPNKQRKLCLKAVRTTRLFPTVPTEREKYIELLESHSSMLLEDKQVTFPRKIFQLISNHSPLCDVVVMECARGERMAELVGRLVSHGDWSGVSSLFERVGTQLKKFHLRYNGMQHGDLQVSNIFVDTSIVFIDIGGMTATGNDVEYFLKSITILAKTYGSEFERIASSSFNRGYCIK